MMIFPLNRFVLLTTTIRDASLFFKTNLLSTKYYQCFLFLLGLDTFTFFYEYDNFFYDCYYLFSLMMFDKI